MLKMKGGPQEKEDTMKSGGSDSLAIPDQTTPNTNDDDDED
jgi:hypothetical protein